MQEKYRALIDGQDFTKYIENWKEFIPTIKRDKTYKSHIATFSQEKLTLTKKAKTYIEGILSEHGVYYNIPDGVSFLLEVYDWSSETYNTITFGSLDLLSVQIDNNSSKLNVDFEPTNISKKILNRDNLQTNLQSLFDFDGNPIIPFTNETIAIDLDELTIDGYTPIGTTQCEIMLAWELFLRLAQKITGRQDALRSTLLGRTDSEVFTYPSDGRRAFIGFSTGLGVRGDSLTSSSGIEITLEDAFNFLNSVEPVGLGIEFDEDQLPRIVIEEIDYFYDSSVVWSVTEPADFNQSVNEDAIFGKILTGYRKNQSTEGGFDLSMHTERNYVTGLDANTKLGYNIRTNYIASGYILETTRNNQITSDRESNEFDTDIFVIQCRRNGAITSTIRESNQDLIASNNVEYPATQYNYQLTPSRILNNHLKIISAQTKIEYAYRESQPGFTGWNPFRYNGGQQNIEGQTQLTGESTLVSENEDKTGGIEPIYLAEKAEIRASISDNSYIEIFNNIQSQIKVTFNGVDYKYYVEELQIKKSNEIRAVLSRANIDYIS